MIRLRPIDIEFVPATFLGKPLAALLVGLGAICCLFVAFGYWESRGSIVEIKQQLDSLEKKLRQISRRTENGIANAELQPMDSAIRNLQLPWNQLLQDMEDSLDDSVSLLRFEPDAGRMRVSMTGECRELSDAVAFAKRLGQTKSLESPTISAYNARQTPNGAVVEFSIQAIWRGI